jgi:hypothetical protein
MDLPLKDYASYRADLEAYEGYAYDGHVVDGVRHEVFGIADRATGDEVVAGRFAPVPLQHDGGRVPLVVQLTSRAGDLPLDRVAELVRSTFVHYYMGHFSCDRIGEVVVRDAAGGPSCVITHDDCMGSILHGG